MRFKLKSQHHIDDLMLDEGTEIVAAEVEIDPKTKRKVVKKPGKIFLIRPLIALNGRQTKEIETNWAGPPSIEMEGMDPEAEAACLKRVETYMSINDLPISPVKMQQA